MSTKDAMQILLAGPRVAHLAPFFEQRGYRVEARESGSAAMQAIEGRLRDLVVLELNLSDYWAPDFLALARGVQPEARYLLLDDTSRAGQIVKALQAGAHGYVATPPDEGRLFEEVDRLLASSSKGLKQQSNAGALSAEVAQVREELNAAQTQLSLVQQELEQANATIASLTDDVESARGEVAAGPSADEVAELRTQAKQVEVLESKLALAEDEKVDLEEELAQLKAMLDESQAQQARNATLLAAQDDLSARAERLEEEAKKVPELEAEIEQLKRSDAERTGAHSNALKASEEKLAQVEKDAQAKLKEMEAKLGATEKKLAEAEAARDKATEEAKSRIKESAEKGLAADKKVREAQQAIDDAEKKVAEADKRAEAEKARAAREADKVRQELKDEIAAAFAARDASEEKYLERELDVDDLTEQLEAAKTALKAAQVEHAEAERAWKKEKLALVEEQELHGTSDAFKKMEAMVDELTRLRQENATYRERHGPPGPSPHATGAK